MELKFANFDVRINAEEARYMAERLISFAESIESDKNASWFKNYLFDDHSAGIQFIYEPVKNQNGELINQTNGYVTCPCRIPHKL